MNLLFPNPLMSCTGNFRAQLWKSESKNSAIWHGLEAEPQVSKNAHLDWPSPVKLMPISTCPTILRMQSSVRLQLRGRAVYSTQLTTKTIKRLSCEICRPLEYSASQPAFYLIHPSPSPRFRWSLRVKRSIAHQHMFGMATAPYGAKKDHV